MQQISFQLDQSYSYIMRKVWYHQIWILNYLSFIVLILSKQINTYTQIWHQFVGIFTFFWQWSYTYSLLSYRDVS